MLITDMPNDLPPDEARMRAALGLLPDSQPRPSGHGPDHSSHRHRFVRDGKVMVAQVKATASDNAPAQSPRSRLIALEDALAAEQISHARTKRGLEEALATIQALETKLAHGELAHAEAVQHEQAARAQVETTLQRLQAQLQEAEVHAQRIAAAATSTPRHVEPAVDSSGSVSRGRSKATGSSEPKPVKWWLPSYRAAQRQR
jgi:hypothetical protein